MIFHPSGTICAQNVRFYLEATIIVHGEVILPICCFPPFSQLFAFAYIYFYLTCSFHSLAGFQQVGPSVPKIFRDDFFTRMGPSVPEITRGDVSPKWDHLCPKR